MPAAARAVVGAGASGVVVDWERRGKRRRQAGADTQINADTPEDLAAVRAAHAGAVLCRVNRWSRWTPAEIDLAVSLGADEVLLPMVRRPEEVDAALDVVAGRCGLGILVETTEAVRRVDELVERPLARLYVGLNDLMIDRGGGPLFLALVDGTVDRVAAAAAGAGIPFGVAGTDPARGRPAGAVPAGARRPGPGGGLVHVPPPVVLGRHRRPRPGRGGPPDPRRRRAGCPPARRRRSSPTTPS